MPTAACDVQGVRFLAKGACVGRVGDAQGGIEQPQGAGRGEDVEVQEAGAQGRQRVPGRHQEPVRPAARQEGADLLGRRGVVGDHQHGRVTGGHRVELGTVQGGTFLQRGRNVRVLDAEGAQQRVQGLGRQDRRGVVPVQVDEEEGVEVPPLRGEVAGGHGERRLSDARRACHRRDHHGNGLGYVVVGSPPVTGGGHLSASGTGGRPEQVPEDGQLLVPAREAGRYRGQGGQCHGSGSVRVDLQVDRGPVAGRHDAQVVAADGDRTPARGSDLDGPRARRRRGGP
ncbi:hypothetical protein [Streptomyces agglomeratus]|uniref:hypothetical protein n=1 Tax=Streptomyces agglomeratus TaxID=285458 RepID=UPI00114CF45C|nr:hypothetical protein [Streptomyces agglomeratus]